jgi:hypothetical protein
MKFSRKLRIATANSDNALHLVQSEVSGITGMPVEVDFQEIDENDLIIELRIDDLILETTDPLELAINVERSTIGVEVLSVWDEPSSFTPTSGIPIDTVVEMPGTPLPAVARRALRDDLPTALWQMPFGRRSRARSDGSWVLAVPLRPRSGRRPVALTHRAGYALRFGTYDVRSIRNAFA